MAYSERRPPKPPAMHTPVCGTLLWPTPAGSRSMRVTRRAVALRRAPLPKARSRLLASPRPTGQSQQTAVRGVLIGVLQRRPTAPDQRSIPVASGQDTCCHASHEVSGVNRQAWQAAPMQRSAAPCAECVRRTADRMLHSRIASARR